ncbi:hypothetical protein [Blastococcus sp. SYSU DS1024]
MHLHQLAVPQPAADAARTARPDDVDAPGDAVGQEGGQSVHGAEGGAVEGSAAEGLWIQPTVARQRITPGAVPDRQRSTVTGFLA